MPNWKKVITSGSNAVLNEITSSGGILTSQDIMPDVDNTLSLGSSTKRFQLNGGTPVTVDGNGSTNTITRFQSATTVENSTISNTDSITTITHDNNGNDIFIVSGSNGELIKVTDTIDNTLFQVNDSSGISMFEVSSSGDSIVTNTINLGQVVNAGTDTDKFLVLDSNGNVDFRTGTEVRSDIGAGSSTNQIHPIQLVADTKNLSSGHISWFSISDLQPNANRGFTTWIAPSDGYLEKVIVSPEQTNTTTANVRIGLVVDGTTQSSTQSVTMGAAGTNKTFTFGSSNYSFTSGERLGLSFDKLTNTADLYNVMVIFRLNS
jgi:hypothetical protein